jgi:putative transposase
MATHIPLDPKYPLHINARTNSGDWFGIPMDEIWFIMEDYLFFIAHEFKFKIYAFVLMTDHFNLLARAPEGNLSKAMRYFMRETSRHISNKANRINHNYGAPFHRSQIPRQHYLDHCYKYIYRNPVRAGACTNVEDYRYSTLQGLLGIRPMSIPMVEDTHLFNPSIQWQTLDWLNRTPNPKDEAAVKRALRRRVFQFAKDRNTREVSHLETERL